MSTSTAIVTASWKATDSNEWIEKGALAPFFIGALAAANTNDMANAVTSRKSLVSREHIA